MLGGRRQPMKMVAFFLAGGFFVLCAGTCEAQVIGHNFYRSSNNVYRAQSRGDGFWGYSNIEHSYSRLGLTGTVQCSYSYEQGDDGYVASEFKDFDKAVALGREILEGASQPRPEPSLGEVARELLGRKGKLEIRN
jgi:hypothetical protein